MENRHFLRPYIRWLSGISKVTPKSSHTLSNATFKRSYQTWNVRSASRCVKNMAYDTRPRRFAHFTPITSFNVLDRNRPTDTSDASLPFNKEYSQVYKLIEDEELRFKYINILRTSHGQFNSSEISMIYSTFHNVIDILSGFSNPDALIVLVEIWKMAFEAPPTKEIVQLQHLLLKEKDKLVHVLINTRNYDLYESLIRPLYSNKAFKNLVEYSWADKLATTFQLEYYGGTINMNRSGIVRFLKSDNESIEAKRKFLSILVHSGIKHGIDQQEKLEFMKLFIELSHHLNDDSFLFLTPEFNDYHRIIRLMATPYDTGIYGIGAETTDRSTAFLQHISKLEDIFQAASTTPETSFHNFITSAMLHLLSFSPNNTLNYWNFKAERSKSISSILTHHDLKYSMEALCSLNHFTEVLALYKSHPSLHHEDQIEVLLEVSEKSKDWKLLQSQFEDMYGQGKLPYVVHYAIVMKALAGIGARDEVDVLFDQLKKRNLAPNSAIFASLISSRLYYNDIDSAKECFKSYLDHVEQGVIDKSNSSYLYRLIFKIHIKSRDLDETMKFLEQTLEEQKVTKISLISSETLNELIEFAGSNFGLKQLEYLRELGDELGLTTVKTFKSLINSYTKLDQFERAHELIYQAHSASDVPFTNAEIYFVQLKNYRFWSKRVASPQQRLFLISKQSFVVDMITRNHIKVVSLRNNSGLLSEVTKYYLGRYDVDNATKTFNLAQKRELLSEYHFLPFLQYHFHQNTYESYGEILNLYRKMVDQKIQISSKTYVYLMRALIYLDSVNNNNGENSYKLLKSIFEMNGLNMKASDIKPPSKVMMMEIFDNSEDLFRIVSAYVLAGGTLQNNIDLLVHFLNQIKEILNGKLSLEFKLLIYKEMSKIYEKQGNLELAEKLVDNGLDDLGGIVQRFNEQYPYDLNVQESPNVIQPVMLIKDYRVLVNAKLRLLGYGKPEKDSFLKILQDSHAKQVKLSGSQFNKLIREVLRENTETPDNDTSSKNIPLVLSVCEENLIAGNWVEVKILKKLQFMYKLAMLHLSQGLGNDATIQKYQILNEYYDIHDLNTLRNDLRHIGDPFRALEMELEVHGKMLNARGWDCNKIIENIPGFFIPERRISSKNKISPSNCYKIWLAIHDYCNGDQKIAFQLMDEYPETIEFLMYNDLARIRLGIFRMKVDKIEPPRNDYQESFEQRFQRTEAALGYMRDVVEDEKYSMNDYE